jgi:hypothetical protein
MIFDKVQLLFRIRIRIHNLNPYSDPVKSFGSLRIRIRIHNTGSKNKNPKWSKLKRRLLSLAPFSGKNLGLLPLRKVNKVPLPAGCDTAAGSDHSDGHTGLLLAQWPDGDAGQHSFVCKYNQTMYERF